MRFSINLMLASVLGLCTLAGCKKNADIIAPLPIENAATSEQLKDSALQYTRDLYLWYKTIPGVFSVASYNDPGELMQSIRQFSIESGFSQPVDRWSFAMKQHEWDNISSGVSGDFGLNVFFNSDNDLRVKSVEEASPAGRAGIRRGWRITAINNNNDITTSNSEFVAKNVFNNASANFTFEKPDGSTKIISLKSAMYQEQPVYLDSIYNMGSKKIGYFVFNSFLGDTSNVYQRFEGIFNRFASEKITDLVVDLRYNGGGYVTVQNKLANYLAPSTTNGQVMMKQMYNDKYSRFNTTEKFKKLGGLNLNRIFFIVSNSTASASELLINNLKPYMEVKIIGPKDTYGKPVGFFPIEVGNWYVFPVSFRSTNKNGEGNYYNGIPVHSKTRDGLDQDWGNTEEACLAQAFKYITTGTFKAGIERKQDKVQENPQVEMGNLTLDLPAFKGMIDVRGM